MKNFKKNYSEVKSMDPGKRLGMALDHLKLSQTGLAEECSVSPQYVNNIIRRDQRITQDFAQSLGGKIGLNLNWLFIGEGPMFRDECESDKAGEKQYPDSMELLLREAAQKLCQIAELLKTHSQ